MQPLIKIDENVCNRCGICSEICPETIFDKDSLTNRIFIQHIALCIHCGHCVTMCPTSAIGHSSFPDCIISELPEPDIPTRASLEYLLTRRRSVRAFVKAKPNAEDIDFLKRMALSAPSAHNHKSVSITFIDDEEVMQLIRNATFRYFSLLYSIFKHSFIRKTLQFFLPDVIKDVPALMGDFKMLIKEFSEQHDGITRGAPLLVLFYADKRISFSDVDCNLAAQNMMTAAHGIGLGSVYCGYVVASAQNSSAINKLLSLGKHKKVYAALAIGKPLYEHHRMIHKSIS